MKFFIFISFLIFSNLLHAEGYKVKCSILLPFVSKARINGEIHNYDGKNKWISNLNIKITKKGISRWKTFKNIKDVGIYFYDLGTDTFNFFPTIEGKKTLIVLRKNSYLYSSVFYDNVHYPSECTFKDS
ncbi:MAG: hypothetical protein H6622_03085 [Halobacteriovoraceae bacterium]|nr:hypothetical protein [Halobacteriovoraceae bacterium]